MTKRTPTDWNAPAMQGRIRKRYRAERRFKFFGMAAVVLSAAFLAFLLVTMVSQGWRGFTRTDVALTIDFKAAGMMMDREAFGTPGYFRLSYALGDDDLVEGISRLQRLFSLVATRECRDARRAAAALDPLARTPPGRDHRR